MHPQNPPKFSPIDIWVSIHSEYVAPPRRFMKSVNCIYIVSIVFIESSLLYLLNTDINNILNKGLIVVI